ncbi:MAG: thioredoxin domain-containing protein [Aggregatilineales bacterium]
MNIINQYSYILIFLGTIASIIWIARHFFRVRVAYLVGLVCIITVVFITGFVILRPGSSNVNDIQAAQAQIGNGQPTFVEFFSNYCTGCIVFEPIISDLVQNIDAEFNVLRVDIHTQVGRGLREIYEFSFTPEFVLYDAEGNEVWRDHIPPTSNDLDAARGLN